MRNLILFVFACSVLSCKKDNTTENITEHNWVLKAQVVSPAITINGKTSTNYLSLQNPEGCSKNFTYVFYNSGVFEYSSNGSLCDMLANSKSQMWKRDGDQITLDYGYGAPLKLNVEGNSLAATSTITNNGETHTLVSTYKAVK